ncbi:unnamed protein product, partial [marine sediment metagenome]
MRRKNIVWTCAYERPEVKSVRKTIRDYITGIILKFCHGAIAYSSYAREYLIERGMVPQKIRIIGNTTDVVSLNERISKFDRKFSRKELGIKKKAILFAGKFTKAKKIDLLLNAVHELVVVRARDDILLLLLGDGPIRDELVRLSHALNIINCVRFEGVVIGGKEKYFSAATLAVMPGSGGLFINDCMASRLPIILSFSDGTHYDLIHNFETGILFNRDDKKDLADKIERLVDDESLRERIASNAEKLILCKYKID